jgi:GxxExxY protein
MDENDIAKEIFNCAIKVHKATGPGLLESAYQECLFYELVNVGLNVEKQKPLPLIYHEIKLEIGYRVDLMVNNKVVIEIKAVETLLPVHKAQLITYLKLSGCKLGILINFHEALLKDGFKRIVNNL